MKKKVFSEWLEDVRRQVANDARQARNAAFLYETAAEREYAERIRNGDNPKGKKV